MSRKDIIAHLAFSRSMSHKAIEGWPADKLAFQRTAADNHPLWVVGHIAGTDAWLGSVIGIPGMSVPGDAHKLFGMGSKPLPSAKDYPPLADLVAAMDNNRKLFIDWYQNATDAQLGISLKEATGGFLSDPVAALLLSAWHEGWHFGQVATLRKELNLPSMFGG